MVERHTVDAKSSNGLATVLPDLSQSKLSRWNLGLTFEGVAIRSAVLPDAVQLVMIDFLSSRKLVFVGVDLAVFTDQLALKINDALITVLNNMNGQSTPTESDNSSVEMDLVRELMRSAGTIFTHQHLNGTETGSRSREFNGYSAKLSLSIYRALEANLVELAGKVAQVSRESIGVPNSNSSVAA